MAAIRARDLAFSYPRSARQALENVSFDVAPGEVFGVLGPNGAGKTTLMKILSTVLIPASGDLEVLGHALPRGEDAVRERLGVAFAEHERAFSFRLSARENLRYFCALYGIPRRDRDAAIDRALATVDLTNTADLMFAAHSTGMKHRLAIARALLPEPDLLVLDEPTAGLDAKTTRELGETLRGLAASGTTILYTTHRLEEAGALCDRVLVLREGRVAAMAAPQQLARLASEISSLVLEVDGLLPDVADVRALPGVVTATLEGRSRLRIQTTDVDATVDAVVTWLRKRGLVLRAISTASASLADAFVAITEGRIQGGIA